jgi:hypothetical protein
VSCLDQRGRLELCPEVRELSVRAHGMFADRLFVGWDIGPTDAGAVLVEGNIAPDVDLTERPTQQDLADPRSAPLADRN